MLDTTFYKRVWLNNRTEEILIDNSIVGLNNYLTAPNIRNKIRHPCFLAIKFSSCVTLYYNRELLNSDKVPDMPTHPVF